MVGDTGIRVIAAFVFLCGLSVTAAFTIDNYNQTEMEFGNAQVAEIDREAVKPVTKPEVADGVGSATMEIRDHETLDYNVHYPRFLTAHEHDTPETSVWTKIWLANPDLGAPDGLGTYNEDYSKVLRIADATHAAL